MKFQHDHFDVQSITGYGPGWISVDKEKITESTVLGSRGQRLAWDCRRFEDLTPEHFAQLAGLDAEVVIFGSGARGRFSGVTSIQRVNTIGGTAPARA